MNEENKENKEKTVDTDEILKGKLLPLGSPFQVCDGCYNRK